MSQSVCIKGICMNADLSFFAMETLAPRSPTITILERCLGQEKQLQL